MSNVFLYNEIKTYCLVSDKTTFLSLSVSKLDILAEKNPTYLSVSVFFLKLHVLSRADIKLIIDA